MISLDELVDIRDIYMDESMDRSERIDYLKEISNNGYVKYDNVLIKLEFKSVFPDDYRESINE